MDEKHQAGARMFVGQLPAHVGPPEVRLLFEPFGAVEDVVMPADRATGRHRGYAFVALASDEAARAAVEALHGKVCLHPGKGNMVVRYADEPSSGRQAASSSSSSGAAAASGSHSGHAIPPRDPRCKLFVANLSPRSDEDAARRLFGPYGDVVEVHLLTNRDGSSRGCGFVRFAAPEQAAGAVAGLHARHNDNTGGGGKPLVVRVADAAGGGGRKRRGGGGGGGGSQRRDSFGPPSGDDRRGPEGANLFVYNIGEEVDGPGLAALFSPLGRVLSARVFVDPVTGISKAFGFVSYASASEAAAAVQALDGSDVGGRRISVSVKSSNGGGGGGGGRAQRGRGRRR